MTNKRIYLTACLAIVAVFITCSLASALPALPTEWKMMFENWEYFNPAIDSSVNGTDNLNLPDENHDGDLFTGTNPNDNNAWEDNWGIAQITQVLDTTSGVGIPVWNAGENGETIRMVYGGLNVSEWTVAGGFETKNSTGVVDSFVSFYLHTEGDANYETMHVSNGPDDRIGMTGYETISDGAGVLLATFDFVEGIGNIDVLTMGNSTASNPPTGNGTGYMGLDGTSGGTWANQILGNVFMNFAFDALPLTDLWDMESTGAFTGKAVPEPATLTLMGLGFIGMAVFARKRMSKKS